jgi:hypothetical protein
MLRKNLLILSNIAIAFVLMVVACNMKTYELLDGSSRVPQNKNVYKNKLKFNASLLRLIDTNAVYEEYDTEYKTLKRLDTRNGRSVYKAYRFYSNGDLNCFGLYRGEELRKEQLDPAYKGYRGVYYSELGKIRYDLFAEIDQLQHIGKISGTITISGDTLLLKRDDVRGLNKMIYPLETYIKRKLPPEFLHHKANW